MIKKSFLKRIFNKNSKENENSQTKNLNVLKIKYLITNEEFEVEEHCEKKKEEVEYQKFDDYFEIISRLGRGSEGLIFLCKYKVKFEIIKRKIIN
jgi:hypothetical protein